MQLDDDLEAAKQMRLPWWGVLCVIVISALIALPFALGGRFNLARPTVYSLAVLGIAIAIKWKLRRHVWFWTLIAGIAALHVPLIVLVPWTTQWIPAVVLTPIAAMDLYLVVAIVSVVNRIVGRTQKRRVAEQS